MSNENGRRRAGYFAKRVPSDAVQGEGSWIEVVGLTLGETKRIAAATEANGGNSSAQVELTEQHIREHLVNWNWLDNNGDPLPLPKDDAAVLDRLYIEEITFISKAIIGDPEAPKG